MLKKEINVWNKVVFGSVQVKIKEITNDTGERGGRTVHKAINFKPHMLKFIVALILLRTVHELIKDYSNN